MSFRDHAIWWPGLMTLPILVAQAVRVRRKTPLLPAVPGPHAGIVTGESATSEPLSIYLIGESTVAGVGARHHDFSLSGRLAHELAARVERSVRWSALGLVGARARDVLEHQIDIELPPLFRAAPPHLLVIALGVNDTTKMTSRKQWRAGLHSIVSEARRHTACPVVFTGLPPMEYFVALPQPLRVMMGARARMLDRDMARVVGSHADCYHYRARFSFDRAYLASDGFHPSELGYREWAAQLGTFITQKKMSADMDPSARSPSCATQKKTLADT